MLAGSIKWENIKAKWIGTSIVWLPYVFLCGEEVWPVCMTLSNHVHLCSINRGKERM